jgi:trehalose 6-phosphate synthase/phosphatase
MAEHLKSRLPGQGRLITVSNRLPIVLSKKDDRWEIEAGSGGLVTALVPVLRDRGGLWIGWPGTTEENTPSDLHRLLYKAGRQFGYGLVPVVITAQEKERFYYGFSNEIVWPIFHDLQTLCNFDPAYWEAYQSVNLKFTDTILRHSLPSDYIWIHDYHLMILGDMLRERGLESSLGFYLHIPFPPLDIFLKLPWRVQILRGLLGFDLIGFQTLRDRRNFLQCVEKMVPDAKLDGDGQVVTIEVGQRAVRAGVFPISIDFRDFARRAKSKDVEEAAWYIHESLPERQIVLGIDRLDYTKGIPYRLEAFRNMLERYPDLHRKVTLLQVVVPSREGIPKYNALKTDIERLVGEINGRFTQPGWVPVHYIFRSLGPVELVAHYRTAEIALITPLKDGMNLVAKEYCASTVDEKGVLILSEFAGAAAEFQEGALLVNPYDIEGVADAIREAFYMAPGERRSRMRRLRREVEEFDIFHWVDSLLRAAFAKELKHFPVLEDYAPQMEVR